MLFSSPEFFLFFAVYFFLHLLVPQGYRVALIIVGSTIFYAFWNPAYIWVPYVLLVIGFYGTLWIVSATDQAARRPRLWFVVVSLLTPLAIVKYADFGYREVLGPIFGFSGRLMDVALPLGISFITFTMIAYVVDVYRGKFGVVRRLSTLAGLVLFFPHLIAGPILRPHDLIPQLAHPHRATRWLKVLAIYGVTIFSVGLLKKLVFADQIAGVVETVFDHGGTDITSFEYVIAIYGFAMQIYCDFSGYTDMAIGAALLLGVRLPGNFLAPYTAVSVADFWRRWHITLSRWLRDYLYIPLGGNRRGTPREIFNIITTMGLGGLWHGANWTFLVWGLFHGMGIAFVHLLKKSPAGRVIAVIPRPLAIFATFHFVALGWILFRARDLKTAMRVFAGPFTAPLGDVSAQLGLYLFPLCLLAVFFVTHRWDTHRCIRRFVSSSRPAVVIPILVLIWVLSIAISAGNSGKFIYFDF